METSQKNITLFLKIGNKYVYDNSVHNELERKDGVIYVSLYFERSFLFRNDILYLNCILKNRNIEDFIENSHLLFLFKTKSTNFKNKLKSILLCNIKRSDFFSFLEIDDVISYYEIYNTVVHFILKTIEIPKDYRYLKYAYICSELISENTLKFENNSVKIRYNPFTRFGRYSTHPDSFNILSLKKDKRSLIQYSENYTYFEFDYNAFEIRTLFALLSINQPYEDLYEKLHKLCKDNLDRDHFKNDLISKLYSKNEDKTSLYKLLIDKKFYQKYQIINGKVENIFGKIMDCDTFHLLSRVLQSSSACILFSQMYKLFQYLISNKLKSKILFSIHDSICLAIHDKEIGIIKDIKNILEDVEISEINYKSKFLCKVKYGKSLGEMTVYET